MNKFEMATAEEIVVETIDEQAANCRCPNSTWWAAAACASRFAETQKPKYLKITALRA